jgi:hypothetical protein
MSQVLGEGVNESFSSGLAPEAMLTVADNRWNEVDRVARLHKCESILLGFRSIVDQAREPGFNELVTDVGCDVVLLRFPSGWKFLATRRILIPIGGRGMHSPLRARLLGTLRRQVQLEAAYVCLVSETTPKEEVRSLRRLVNIRAEDEMGGQATTLVEVCNDPAADLIQRSRDYDMLIVGLQQTHDRRRAMGDFTLRIAGATDCGLIVIGQKRDEPALRLPEVLRSDRFRRERTGP